MEDNIIRRLQIRQNLGLQVLGQLRHPSENWVRFQQVAKVSQRNAGLLALNLALYRVDNLAHFGLCAHVALRLRGGLIRLDKLLVDVVSLHYLLKLHRL